MKLKPQSWRHVALLLLSFAIPAGVRADGVADWDALAVQTTAAPQASITYTVNSPDDDASILGQCEDRASKCTLRGAIQAANNHAGDDRIQFNIPTGSVIILAAALPIITEDLEITGPGPDKLTVSQDTGSWCRIFEIRTSGGVVSFSGLIIAGGQVDVDNYGGGIASNGGTTLNLTNCRIIGNSSRGGVGGGIAAFGVLNISNCRIENNIGGGIFHNSGKLFITDTTISGNSGGDGGGIHSYSTEPMTIVNSTIIGNSARFRGAGIFHVYGELAIFDSLISGNSADDGGGGLFNRGTVDLTNCTVTGNSAFEGGGILNESDALVNISNSTVSGNHAATVGGGSSNRGVTRVKSSIIALNDAANGSPNVAGSFSSEGFNLIGDNGGVEFTVPAGYPNANNDFVGTSVSPINPRLDPNGLQDNGGPTLTIALLVGSPAIDRGTSNGLTGAMGTDQRGTGYPRTSDDPASPNGKNGGDGTDIGAYELQTTTATKLANISTRLRVGTGDNALIGGFIVTGTQPKKVIIRAIGPSLGLSGQLANPTLELYTGQTLLNSNDNWIDSPDKQAIIDSTIPPTNDLESAIVATLAANGAGYTAVVRGANNTTGIAVVQVYDLDRSVDSKLANISTRGLVQTSDNVLIAGTIVLGEAPQKVIIRAIGPSLNIFGELLDPTLQLVDGNGTQLAFNDNWRTGGQEAEIIATTVPPTNDAESAIVYDLPANGASYTAIVRGAGNTTGIAVVEVYALN